MRILIWHVHGSWTTAFVQGGHDYVVPVVPDRGPDGRGRAQTWDWPPTVVERSPEELAGEDIDVVILQRPRDEELLQQWLPGCRAPKIWVEHNAPQGRINEMRHPAADRDDLVVVHVTRFNQLFWDCGSTRTAVVDHGIVDPGHRYTGELPRIAVAANEPVRRNRVLGTDLLPAFASVAPLDVFGMRVHGLARHLGLPPERLGEHEDLPQHRMHAELARRRVYLHPVRWTSLGLSLLEAMHLGLPVVALATTEVVAAVPPGAGVVSPDVDRLRAAAHTFLHDPDLARESGARARQAALDRYGLQRFLDDWDKLLADAA